MRRVIAFIENVRRLVYYETHDEIYEATLRKKIKKWSED